MKRKRVVAVAGALALAATAVMLVALPAGAGTPDESRTITVNGTGTVKAVPDQAEWSFGAQSDGATAAEALKANGAAMAKVIAALKGEGIAAADLRTEQVSLFPKTSPDGTKVTGYTASSSVHAVIRDLAKAGPVVDAATEAGANQIFGPTLTISDSESLYEQALDKAYEQAKAKAGRLAGTAGASLGRVVSLVEGGGSAPIPLAKAADATAASGGTPIEPGATDIQGFVTVTFALT
jgi:uncharacterized protein YggE